MQLQLDPLLNPATMVSRRRCGTCGGAIAPYGYDWVGQWNDRIVGPALESWNRMWTGVWEPWARFLPQGQPAAGGGLAEAFRPERLGGDCRPEPCHCSCCIVDADLVVYARVGETRMVPVIIENNVRRKREVELQLSDWSAHGEPAIKVTGEITPPTEFTLEPCEERSVVVTIRVAGEGVRGKAANQAADVDGCKVFYADLRVKGCDMRPVRIAAAVLSRDCSSYRIGCGCSCC